MHVVEHHMIYSPEKIQQSFVGTQYIHIMETWYIKIYIYAHNVLTLSAAASAVSHLKWVGSIPCSCFLHCCWVSTTAIPSIRKGRIWLGLHSPPPSHTLLKLVPGISGSGQFPGLLSGTLFYEYVDVHALWKKIKRIACISTASCKKQKVSIINTIWFLIFLNTKTWNIQHRSSYSCYTQLKI